MRKSRKSPEGCRHGAGGLVMVYVTDSLGRAERDADTCRIEPGGGLSLLGGWSGRVVVGGYPPGGWVRWSLTACSCGNGENP